MLRAPGTLAGASSGNPNGIERVLSWQSRTTSIEVLYEGNALANRDQRRPCALLRSDKAFIVHEYSQEPTSMSKRTLSVRDFPHRPSYTPHPPAHTEPSPLILSPSKYHTELVEVSW